MFINDGSENMVHHGLKCGRGVSETKEHDCWLEDSKWGFKHCFPLISQFDLDIVVPPMDVEFGKNEHMDQVGNCLLNIRQGAVVLDSVLVQDSIILYRMIFSILFRYVKHGGSNRGLRWNKVSSTLHIVEPFAHCHPLFGV